MELNQTILNAMRPLEARIQQLEAQLRKEDGAEDARERIVREREERTEARRADTTRDSERKAQPINPRRRDEQVQRTQKNLPGPQMNPPRPAPVDASKDPMEFFVVHRGKLKKIRLLKNGGLTEVKA